MEGEGDFGCGEDHGLVEGAVLIVCEVCVVWTEPVEEGPVDFLDGRGGQALSLGT